ncbi:hypothetical protein AVEN_81835-1 [Araneus ventricosus]|uniref:Uncharacterized protein n=1 Tax=Araneus ventricosus TaxID=182803 RepID=A0A4Y2I4R2_ARAVE|nr:hypothetical protein AVEN_81835-1 [Araneus ventricosus]
MRSHRISKRVLASLVGIVLRDLVFPPVRDDVLSRCTRPIRELLDSVPEYWIGREGQLPWAPRSPDITPLDFFLWGFVKDIVYQTCVTDTLVSKEWMQLPILTAVPQILKSTAGNRVQTGHSSYH